MSARVQFDGLAQLKADLRRLPADLTNDATDIVMTAANDAARDIIAEYPEVTGTLDKGVKVTITDRSAFGIAVRVRSSAKHASWWEHGSQARHYITRNGRKKSVGRMPANHTVAKAAGTHRPLMWKRLKAMLVKHGAEVSGDA